MTRTSEPTIDRTGGSPIDERMRAAAARSLAAVIAEGAEAWDRSRMLPRLLPLTTQEIADTGRDGRMAVLRRLAWALRGERRRGRAGASDYSLDRHIALLQAIAAEKRDLPPPEASGRQTRPAGSSEP